jgi:hypothetical protein
MAATITPHQRIHPASWPRWPLQTILWILFLGPPVAALCIASTLPILTDLGWYARSILTTYVCPTPAKSYELLAAPMAVCTRCWGATIGLWAGWLLTTRLGHSPRLAAWFTLPVLVRLLTAALPFGLWWAEIAWYPTASLELLLVNGAFAGTTAGLFFCSIWPGLRTSASHT